MVDLVFLWKIHSWYPPECCSGQDCLPVEAVEHRVDDTLLRAHGIWWPLKAAKRRLSSPDGEWHICIYDFGDGKGLQIVCVFEPAGS